MNATITCPHPRCRQTYFPPDREGWFCVDHGTFTEPDRVVVVTEHERRMFQEKVRLF